jgi:transposase-like protein
MEFLLCQAKDVPAEKQGIFGYGNVWTWTALCADTKLVASWMVAGRDGEAAKAFINDLAGRLAKRVQLTTDRHRAYLEAVEGAFGGNIDDGQLSKVYGEGPKQDQRRFPIRSNSNRESSAEETGHS